MRSRRGDRRFGQRLRRTIETTAFLPGLVGTALRLRGPDEGVRRVSTLSDGDGKFDGLRVGQSPQPSSLGHDREALDGNVGQFQWGLHGDDGDLEIQVLSAAGEKVSVREYAPLPLRSWEFVAFVFDGTNLRLYRNGLEIGSAACKGINLHGTSDLGIGVKLGPDGKPATHHPGFFDGRIDELAIFHRTLSAGEIDQLYQAGLPPMPKVASGREILSEPGFVSPPDRVAFSDSPDRKIPIGIQ